MVLIGVVGDVVLAALVVVVDVDAVVLMVVLPFVSLLVTALPHTAQLSKQTAGSSFAPGCTVKNLSSCGPRPQVSSAVTCASLCERETSVFKFYRVSRLIQCTR